MKAVDLWLRLRALVFPRRVERDLEDELAFHLEMQARKHAAAGADPAEARRLARARFGPSPLVRDQCRDARGTATLDNLARDIRHSLGSFWRTPIFGATVIVTLALGLGFTTAVFAVIDAVLVRPLPYPSPERVMRLRGPHPQAFVRFGPGPLVSVSPPELAGSPAFTALAPLEYGGMNLGTSSPQRIRAAVVGVRFFEVLDVSPAAGRLIGSGDERTRVAVLSARLWGRVFNRDPAIVGRSVQLNDQSFTVVGVAAPGVDFPELSDVWIPVGADTQVRSGQPANAPRRRPAGSWRLHGARTRRGRARIVG